MNESIRIFITVVLGIIGVVALIVIGWLALIAACGLIVYFIPFILAVSGLKLFMSGGEAGAVGLFLLIPGVLLSAKAYFKCRKCGLSVKIFWMGDFEEYGDMFGTKCLRCRDRSGWWEF